MNQRHYNTLAQTSDCSKLRVGGGGNIVKGWVKLELIYLLGLWKFFVMFLVANVYNLNYIILVSLIFVSVLLTAFVKLTPCCLK